MVSSFKRWRHKELIVGLVLGATLTVVYLRSLQSLRPPVYIPQHDRPASRPSLDLPCSRLPGANDTLVIMRTGGTEVQDKLPVHLATTMRCYPNYIIFADFEENYRGEHIIDALDSVDPVVKHSHPDFSLYRRLRANGRAALSASELSGPESRDEGGTGKAENPGWKLDKWKFLPMVNRTLYEYPDMKWYLFIETDTYIFWATLLQYLATLDYTKPHYLGAQTWIGEVMFAHGGAGFAVSQKALYKVVQYYTSHKKEWEDFTDGHWAGDCVLGKAFKDASAPLTLAWPIFQSEKLGVIPYDRTVGDGRLWCHPTVSYHHLTRDTIEDLWEFEQQWLRREDKDALPFLRHKDVFMQYTVPRMRAPKVDWDNQCEDDQGTWESQNGCEAKCDSMDNCLQYSFDPQTGSCKTSIVPRLGEAKDGVNSGWMIKRIEQFPATIPPCGNEGWL